MQLKNAFRALAVVVLAVCLFAALPTEALATQSSSSSFIISTSPSASLGSISFKTSNSKRVEVGKSTYLYITISDMSGSITTSFSCSNTSIASIEKINNTCVKVYGLKTGEVVITATAGGKTAKYSLVVGDEDATTTSSAIGGISGAQTTSTAALTLEELLPEEENVLSAYIEEKRQKDIPGIILGLIGWAAIIAFFSMILSVMFNNRTPKLNVSPGTKHRFTSGGLSRRRKRLLPDHYYRNIKKY